MFANSPVNTRDAMSMVALYEFAAKYALKQPVALNIRLSKDLPRNLPDFEDLCVRHNILELYVWLANRYPKYFIEMDLCSEQKNFAIKQIEGTLMASTLQRTATHEASYVKNRGKLRRLGLVLPAGDFPHIQASVKENLSKIPPELLVIVDEDVVAMQSSASASSGHHYGQRNRNHRNSGSSSTSGGSSNNNNSYRHNKSKRPQERPLGGVSKDHKSAAPSRPVVGGIVTPIKATVAPAPTIKVAVL